MVCCAAVGCSTRPGQGIPMHRFPRNPERSRVWAATVRGENWQPGKNSYLCDLHFECSQYEKRRADGVMKLKPNAVPSICKHLSGGEGAKSKKSKSSSKKESSKASLGNKEGKRKRVKATQQEMTSTEDVSISFGCEGKQTRTRDVNADEKLKMSQLMQELYNVMFQRNQLVKTMQSLQELANIDLDVFSLTLEINPEGKMELDKVSKLVQTIMIEAEIARGYDVTHTPMKQHSGQMEKDNSLQRKPSYNPNKSLSTQDFSETRRDDTTGEVKQECNQNVSNYGNTEYDDSLFTISLLRFNQEKKQDAETQTQTQTQQTHKDEVAISDEKVNKNTDLQKPGNFDDDSFLHRDTCEFCGKKFMTTKNLAIHMWMAHKKKLPTDCKICGKVFKLRKQLISHMNTHKKENHLQCSLCGKTFKWQTSFDRHIKSTHSEEKPFGCSLCSKRFKQRSNMITHEKWHMNRKRSNSKRADLDIEKGVDNLYHCKICNKGFRLPRHVKDHMVLHSSEKPFQCAVCGKSFKWRHCFRNHIKFFHSEERPYQCSLCPKKFHLGWRLRAHEKGHEQREPFKCSLCDKTFKLSRSLQKHQVVHAEKLSDKTSCRLPGDNQSCQLPDNKSFRLPADSQSCRLADNRGHEQGRFDWVAAPGPVNLAPQPIVGLDLVPSTSNHDPYPIALYQQLF